jgi:hypothetical protein
VLACNSFELGAADTLWADALSAQKDIPRPTRVANWNFIGEQARLYTRKPAMRETFGLRLDSHGRPHREGAVKSAWTAALSSTASTAFEAGRTGEVLLRFGQGSWPERLELDLDRAKGL